MALTGGMRTVSRLALRFFYPALAVCALCAGFARGESEVMRLIDMNGREMNARLISCDGDKIEVKRESDGKRFTLPVESFDSATRKRIREWMESGGNLVETYEVTVDTGKTRKRDGTEDFDDKRVNLDPKITIRNPHIRLNARGGKVTVLFLGRPVENNSDLYVMGAQTFDLPNLAPLASENFKMERITQAYDNRGYAQFGARYTGYVLLIHEEGTDRILFLRGVPASLASHGARLLPLKTGRIYDKSLKEKGFSGR